MDNSKHDNNPSAAKPQKASNIFSSASNSIAIYTFLRLLFKMRSHLGLEAMLEYVEKYLSVIDKNNPEFKTAVGEAINLISIEKMYKDIANRERS
ncbi:MAG: hypothetical protein WC676_08450 [Candidatus Omnitrophota bacterium]